MVIFFPLDPRGGPRKDTIRLVCFQQSRRQPALLLRQQQPCASTRSFLINGSGLALQMFCNKWNTTSIARWFASLLRVCQQEGYQGLTRVLLACRSGMIRMMDNDSLAFYEH